MQLRYFSFFWIISVCVSLEAQNISDVDVNTFLNSVEINYANGEEQKAADDIRSYVKKHADDLTRIQKVELTRWYTRISYELKEMTATDSAINILFTLDSNPDYEKFFDKVEHFEVYFKSVEDQYNAELVYINKNKESLDLTPAVVTVYTQEDIQAMGARNLLDLLRITPGFTELGGKNERNIGVRGITSTTVHHILFLLDGHRVNDLLASSAAPDWFSLDYIKQVEIMRGPGSALYGGNAFGGVVSIRSKTGADVDGIIAKATLGSANLSNANSLDDHHQQYNFQFGKVYKNKNQLFASGSYMQSGGSKFIRNEDTRQEGNSLIYPDFLEKSDSLQILHPANTSGTEYINRYLPGYNLLARYAIKNVSVTANAQSSNLVINRPKSQNLWSNSDPENLGSKRRRDDRQFIFADIDLPGPTQWDANFHIQLSVDRFYKDIFDRPFSDSVELLVSGDTIASRLVGQEFRYSANAELYVNDLTFIPDRKSYTIFGLQGSVNDWSYRDHVATNGLSEFSYDPNKERYPKTITIADTVMKYLENTAALLYQTNQHIIDDKLVLTVGFRLNYHSTFANYKTTFKYGNEISPRASLVYKGEKINQSILNIFPYKFKILYNSAFLSPEFDHYRDLKVSKIEDLQSEHIESLEWLAKGNITPSLEYSIGGYINRVDHIIEDEDFQRENVNRDRRISGMEIGIHLNPDLRKGKLNLFSSLTTTQKRLATKEDESHDMIKTIFNNGYLKYDSLENYPGLTWYGSLNYSVPILEDHGLQLSSNFTYLGKSIISYKIRKDLDMQSDRVLLSDKLEGRFVLNLNVRYVLQNSSISVAIFNLFNKDYNFASPSSITGRIQAEKRTMLLTVSHQF